MGTLNISATQYRLPLQNIQDRYVRLELLNYKYQTVDRIEGVCTGGSIAIDANSDVRRTGSVTLVVTDSSFQVGADTKIWLDKYIKVYVGTYSFAEGQIDWVNCGMFIIDAPSYQYEASSNTLSLSLLDLMAKLTGVRNGYLPGIPTVFKAGENIREAIIDTLALGGFTKYIVDDPPDPGTIPNDLEFSQGATVYELLSGLRDIYPNYEMYFDIEGVFYYKKIPTGENDPVYVDDSLWENLVISEQIDVDFQNVKNVIEVYGRTHDPEAFSTETTVSSNIINLTIESVSKYTEDMIYGFTLTDNPGYTGASLKINNLTAYPLKMDDGTTAAEIVAEEGEVYYCVQFKGTYWYWLGHLQSYGYAEDENPESPFYTQGTVGEIRLPLYGGDYENCFTDDLAQQRAEYELWLHTNMNNTVQLTCVPVYWLDVNILVNYTPQRNTTSEQYIIKSITFGLAPTETMSVSMIKFYPEYPDIIDN